MTDRQTSLDALREIMVTLVFCHRHILNNGWVHVSMFIVIPGLLITSSLLSPRNNASFRNECWLRRITRILLSLVPMLLVVATLNYAVAVWLPGFLLSSKHLVAYLHLQVEKARPLWLLAASCAFGTSLFIFDGLKKQLCRGL